MKNIKENGITLIALIITIVVLLILAGVTMSFVVGDNGVVTQAQKSKIRTDQASAKEEIDLEVAGSRNDEGYLDLELLNENLMKNLKDLKLKKKGTTGDKDEDFEDFDNDKIKIENLPATVYYKQTEVTINEKQLISDVAKDVENYGMYVDYPIDLSGDGKYTNDWKIFYEDETGRVFLIAADYVPNTCSILQKKDGNSDELIAGMKKKGSYLYWNPAPNYTCYDGHNTSLNPTKPQCSFPEIFMLAGKNNTDEHTTNHYYCSDHYTEFNSRCASTLQCTEEWSGFVNSKYAEYAIGGPTLEMWVASWNQKYGQDKCKDGITLFANGNNNTSKFGYCVGDTANCTDTAKSITGCTEGYNDTLYFPHKSSSSLNLFEENGSSSNESTTYYGYWLASPSASDDYLIMEVNCDGSMGVSRYNNPAYGGAGFGVRPVVSLQSGVYVEVQEEVTAKDNTVIKSCTLVK